VQDVPSNWDYSFRAGIFAGDYSGVTVGPDEKAWALWTDTRNGRSSRNELGRNPLCEQSDVFAQTLDLGSNGPAGEDDQGPNRNARVGDLNAWAVALCPTAQVDRDTVSGDHRFHG
jgi:hypothetical protein